MIFVKLKRRNFLNDKGRIISAIENMTVLELSELVKELQDKFGVTAAAPVAVAAALPVLLKQQKATNRI